MNRLLFLFILFFVFSCEYTKDNPMSFKEKDIIKDVSKINNPLPPFHTWYIISGDVKINNQEKYKQEETLWIKSPDEDSNKKVLMHYVIDLSELEGNNLTIKGNYKLNKKGKTNISLLIIQPFGLEMKVDSLILETPVYPQWNEFHFECPLDMHSTEAIFCISGEGDMDILINNCQAWINNQPLSDVVNKKYKAGEDGRYARGSGIELDQLTPQMTENLEVLCRVWGFMKYYHPEVTQGNYNWDDELFRILPKIAHAKDKTHRNLVLNKWIDKYGQITDTVDYTVSDSSKYSRFIHLDWINDTIIFDDKVISKLHRIKNARRSKKFNYYIVPDLTGREKFLWAPFEREKKYSNITWEDQGFRTLALFRLWNMIEYCFPYTEYTDCFWPDIIKDFIPAFVFPENELDYRLAVTKMTAKINDSHGNLKMESDNFLLEPLYPFRGKNRVPVELIQTAEGHIVVKSTSSYYFERGDIIHSVSGKNIGDIIEEISPYIIASNRGGIISKILPYVLSANDDEFNVEITRNGKNELLTIKNFMSSGRTQDVSSWKKYNLDSKGILHCYEKKDPKEIKDMILGNLNSKGLIIDLRDHSVRNILSLPSVLLAEYPLWISENVKNYPGNYKIPEKYDRVPKTTGNPDFKGKIIILVDENTISNRETFAMQFRNLPNSVIVGRQTAGANGSICSVALPGGIELRYTQIGAYYPHWDILQRQGVKIDIPVSPSVDDIKNGRDMWIEKAIEIIEN